MRRQRLIVAALAIAAAGVATYFLADGRYGDSVAFQRQNNPTLVTEKPWPNSGVEDRVSPTPAQIETNEFLEHLAVQLRPMRRIDASNYPVEDYDALKELALKGDSDAAFLLAQWLESCQQAPPPESEKDLEKAINDIEQTHSVRSYREGKLQHGQLKNPTQEQIALAQEVQRRQFKSCNAVSLARRDEADTWLDLAESNGSYEARMRRAASGRLPADESVRVLSELWQAGDPAALLSLSKIYRDEYNSGGWPDAEPKSVGAELAFLITQEALMLEAELSDKTSNHLERVNAAVSHRLSMLVPYKREEAYEFARELLASNQNCCVTNFRRSQPE